jgi:hypothetical protein
MNITYVDDTPGKMELNANGEWVVTAPQNKVIKTFTTNTQAGGTGQTYLMGRMDDMPIKLNIDSAGTLGFRPPDADGIPIGTVEEFQMINKNHTTLARKYYQEDDLDLMGNLGNQWTPIGRFGGSFTGVFDGRGYSIDNIYVVEADRGAGLFGHINGNAKLQNIHIKSGSVTGWTDVGGIVGSQWDNNQNTTILNCSNAASVTQTDTGILGKAGGITGGNMAGGMVIIACKNEGAVSGNWHVGGIAGGGDANFTIISCYNTGDITAVEYVGGIVGSQAAGQLRACYNQGSVNEPPSWHSPYGGGGGVLGYGSVAVTNCYWNSEAQNSAGTKTEAFDNGRGIPYDGSVNGPGFPDVSAVSGWETSTNGANGYWKPGTTSGGIKHGRDAAVNLPRLWWE